MLPVVNSARAGGGVVVNISSADFAGSTDAAKHDLLSEPIRATVRRDLLNVWEKLKYVLMPASRQEKGGILKQWDLWGPLILCLALSMILWAQADMDQKRAVFALVFIITWIGAGTVTANVVLLGFNVSFFQSVCVLGYCLFPLVGAAGLCLFIPHAVNFLKLLVVGGGIYWACGASTSFIAGLTSEEKKILAVYPVWLFYIIIGWLIVLM